VMCGEIGTSLKSSHIAVSLCIGESNGICAGGDEGPCQREC
jgi:hypothetical protein